MDSVNIVVTVDSIHMMASVAIATVLKVAPLRVVLVVVVEGTIEEVPIGVTIDVKAEVVVTAIQQSAVLVIFMVIIFVKIEPLKVDSLIENVE